MSIEDGFCTLAELADGMAAAVVTKYARPPGEVFTWQDSDGELDSMDTSENIRIVSRQNAVLEILRLIDQGEISPLNMSLMPAAQPVPYEYFDRRIIRREQAAQILQRMFGTTPAPQPQAAAPEPAAGGTAKKWTPEALRELANCREKHGTEGAAAHFGISATRVRQLLPSEKKTPAKHAGVSVFTHRIK